MKSQYSILIFLLIAAVSACSSLNYDSPRVANSSLIIGNVDHYFGKYVRVIGYIHEREGVYTLLPSKEYSELPDRSRVMAQISIQQDIESTQQLAACSGKLTMLSGKISVFSGLPSIKEISYVECSVS
ncbi:hypothetical protein HXX02_00225 [Microbulbifer elongatus]|uniref:Lipoprotein n=1 Tax=Microbulbifer elongatus TaxID=86173 RepID=A0ABT1NVC1_9GAMM|nr:hypothetical protein [Microbulbifer elongatus]MCQ3827861.1 hypothetical protein [Microbulbifer elongatus]